MQTIHVIVEGKVQGVCFRDYTNRQAHRLQLTGWVRNRPDGTVEALVRGDDGDVATMLDWLKKGPPMSRVDNIRISDIASEEHFSTFEVRY
jgi:acylphosphatase